MIAAMAERISSFFITNDIITDEQKEMYIYSFEILISTIVNFLLVLIIASVSGCFLETLCYLAGFVPLRLIAGGYHAKSHMSCLATGVFSYVMYLILLLLLPPSMYLGANIFALAVSIPIIFKFAPTADENKPLSRAEKKKFKKQSRKLIIIASCVILLLLLLGMNNRFVLSTTLGILTVCTAILVSKIK